ncbi:hypothetical protein IDG52_00505 [Pelagibacterales bacterium SAG-MED23]|nr:hypothetical protein [Pelagibacterales bacterium SAG-MED23]
MLKKIKIFYQKLLSLKYNFFLDNHTKKYIKFNKSKFLNSSSNNEHKGIILIDFFDWKPFIFFWSILANYLRNKNNLQIKYFYFPLYEGISSNHLIFKKPLKKIYESFGSKLGLTNVGKYLNNEEVKKFERYFYKIKSKEQLIKYKFKNILLGDLIYDSVVRTYQLPTVDLFDQRLKKKFIEAHQIFILIEEYLQKNNVKYLIPSDCVYNQYGIITRICFSKKIKVLILYNLGRGMVNFKLSTYKSDIKSNKNPYHKYKLIFKRKFVNANRYKALKIGKKLLHSRVLGRSKHGINYLNKNPFLDSKSKNKNKLFYKNSYQCVIVLHNFFDAPHKYRSLFYNDYLEWVIDTINILKHKNINCYIKFHPIKIEQSADEKAYKIISSKIKNLQNFKILQSNISYVELVNNGLKAAITCHGTVANELPYYGIKVINCGDNPHINYKFSSHPKSRVQYKHIIQNIENLKLNISLSELYEFHYLNYFYFEDSYLKNRLNSNWLTKTSKKKKNEENIEFNNSSKYFDFIIKNEKKNNIIKKIEKYVDEYITNNVAY